MKCKHQPCDNPVTAIDMSRYGQPIPLCGKHYNEFSKTPLGSDAEASFLARCKVVTAKAIDTTVNRLVEIL